MGKSTALCKVQTHTQAKGTQEEGKVDGQRPVQLSELSAGTGTYMVALYTKYQKGTAALMQQDRVGRNAVCPKRVELFWAVSSDHWKKRRHLSEHIGVCNIGTSQSYCLSSEALLRLQDPVGNKEIQEIAKET